MKTLNPFDFVKDISKDKKGLITDKYTEGCYVPYIVNRAFSLFDDSIFHANQINQFPDLDNKLQHDYLFYSLRPKTRFKKWPWKKDTNESDILLIMEVYKYNRKNAIEALRILTEQQLQDIKKQQEKGGIKNDRSISGDSSKER